MGGIVGGAIALGELLFGAGTSAVAGIGAGLGELGGALAGGIGSIAGLGGEAAAAGAGLGEAAAGAGAGAADLGAGAAGAGLAAGDAGAALGLSPGAAAAFGGFEPAAAAAGAAGAALGLSPGAAAAFGGFDPAAAAGAGAADVGAAAAPVAADVAGGAGAALGPTDITGANVASILGGGGGVDTSSALSAALPDVTSQVPTAAQTALTSSAPQAASASAPAAAASAPTAVGAGGDVSSLVGSSGTIASTSPGSTLLTDAAGDVAGTGVSVDTSGAAAALAPGGAAPAAPAGGSQPGLLGGLFGKTGTAFDTALTGLEKVAPLALVGSMLMQGKGGTSGANTTPDTSQLGLLQANATGNNPQLMGAASNAVNSFNTGTISAPQQAQIDNFVQNATNQLRQQYLSAGRDPTNDTDYVQGVQQIQLQALAMEQQFLNSNLAAGLSEQGAANTATATAGSLVTNAAQIALQQDANYQAALANAMKGVGTFLGSQTKTA